jgi:hypothetical protein
MDGKNLRRIVFFLSFSIALLWADNQAFPSPSYYSFDIQSHSLKIQIVPPKHLLKAEDQIEILLKDERAQILSFLLNSNLRITRINLRTGEPISWRETPHPDRVTRLDVSVPKVRNPLSLSISYEGPIYDPVVKEKALQFVRGDETAGLIGSEGVYLSSSSYWFPDKPGSMAIFHVEARIPEPFRIITQGECLFEKLKDGIWESKWSNDLQTEGLSLVAGKYEVKTRKLNDIKISTYFFPEDNRFSEVFLDAAEEYLKIYSDLLGPYPYKKFDIVQNFFSSGYGFPTFTLLAPEAIRQGKEFLRPGALDHEIVHSWWGHYVSVKPGTGNWVEALTTYCTNYYYKELKMEDEAARKHRHDVMQKYAIQVPSSEDYPLRDFEEKRDEVDGQIGYGKGSMVFHMLRRTVGRELFFATLRNFSEQFGGGQASWDDLKEVFEEASNQKLDKFFSQWLDRPGGPQLKLENVEWQVTSKGYLVSGEVVQVGDIYQLAIPLKIEEGTETSSLLEISKRRNPFSITVANLPVSITLDPRSHLFRRLSPEEIIPGLNALLEDPEKVYVVSDREDGERRKSYLELARMAKEKKGGEILSLKEVTGETALRSSLMLLGDSWKDPLFSKLISNIPSPVYLKNGVFHLDGEKVDEGDESLLLTYPHPFRPGKWVTIYFGQSAAALSRARFIFFYGWDSYLLFKKGKPERRGSFSGKSPFISYDLLSKDLLNEISSQRLKDDVSHLASKELTGRFPGTPGYQKGQAYLVQQLEGMGLSPILQPFTVRVKDIEKASLILRRLEREEKIRAFPFYFSKEGEWKGPLTVKDFNGKAALLSYSDLSQGELLDKIKEVQSKGAKAILVLVKEEDLDRLAPYITYPSSFPPELEERLKQREREGYFFHRLIQSSKTVSRAHRPDFSIHIPILVIPYSQRGGWVKNLVDEGEGDATIELSLQFKEMHLRDSNLGGIIYGRDPERKGEFLVLGAHYDHLGKDEKGGFYSGADDNASGVAALLEIGRSLVKRKTDLRRSVILLLFGGEEWGLKGSEHLIKNPLVPLNQVKAMFSLDSIGGSTDEKEVFFIGGSFYPSLAERSRRFLYLLGMKEGRDIDRYAFSFGSDHYPFHQKGIPSLDYFSSDYKKLHTFRDNLEAIDFNHLAQVTRLIYLTAYEFLTEP